MLWFCMLPKNKLNPSGKWLYFWQGLAGKVHCTELLYRTIWVILPVRLNFLIAIQNKLGHFRILFQSEVFQFVINAIEEPKSLFNTHSNYGYFLQRTASKWMCSGHALGFAGMKPEFASVLLLSGKPVGTACWISCWVFNTGLMSCMRKDHAGWSKGSWGL